ncbi:MAG: hypothetical protein QJR07_19125 [Acetobacteraceae bacterium]|nr:hypothetical protein [Acetobacteraceae bacterium]
MLNRFPIIAAVILAASVSAPAFAQSSASQGMSHDTMGHTDTMEHSTQSSGSGMGHTGSMGRHDTMNHDAMGKKSMAHDPMSSGAMGHDSMSKSR